MGQREIGRMLRQGTGWTRVALGLLLLIAPRRAAQTWFGGDETPAAVTLLFRSVGARDLALGAGLLAEAPGERRWTRAGAVADLGDSVASLSAVGPIPAAKLVPGSVLAIVFAAAGFAIERLER